MFQKQEKEIQVNLVPEIALSPSTPSKDSKKATEVSCDRSNDKNSTRSLDTNTAAYYESLFSKIARMNNLEST